MADKEQAFPYDVAYGLSRMFRVRCLNVGTYHIEQKVARATETEPAKWQCLAISNHFSADEALGVMHEAQMSYAVEVQSRRKAIGAQA